VNVLETKLKGVLVIEPDVFGDARGFFMESWNGTRYEEHGIPDRFVQDNLSFSAHGVLRGLHFQNPKAQGKLVSVLLGEVFDVAVDIRVGSPTFGGWTGSTLSAENRRQLWVPPGFAHGFVVTGESALFSYKCTDYFAPEYDRSILWNDPAIGIKWPIQNPSLSDKDRAAPPLNRMPERTLPHYADD
jgi:dTDP-4-dehydrorhamnose 3,5-epimerase